MPVRMDHDQSWTFPHQAHNQVSKLTFLPPFMFLDMKIGAALLLQHSIMMGEGLGHQQRVIVLCYRAAALHLITSRPVSSLRPVIWLAQRRAEVCLLIIAASHLPICWPQSGPRPHWPTLIGAGANRSLNNQPSQFIQIIIIV